MSEVAREARAERQEGGVEARNWKGSIVSRPAVVVYPASVEEIAAILKDPARYPAPVRAVGSNHSTTRCAVAEGGTVIDMTGMNRILSIEDDRVTAQAGALRIDVAKELERHGKQFHVNVELGNLTIGSACSGGTKDASMPDEYGQVNSYAIGIKMVLPSGELLEVTEDDPELVRVVRSSYGLLGVIYEATFRIKDLQPIAVEHITYTLEESIADLPRLKQRGDRARPERMPLGVALEESLKGWGPDSASDPGSGRRRAFARLRGGTIPSVHRGRTQR